MTNRKYYWLSITNVNGVGGSALLSFLGPISDLVREQLRFYWDRHWKDSNE